MEISPRSSNSLLQEAAISNENYFKKVACFIIYREVKSLFIIEAMIFAASTKIETLLNIVIISIYLPLNNSNA